MIAIARVLFAEEVDVSGGFVTIKVTDSSSVGELKEKAFQKVSARIQQGDSKTVTACSYNLLYLEGDGIARAEEKTPISFFQKSSNEAASVLTFFLLPKEKDPTPATRAYCTSMMNKVFPTPSPRRAPPPPKGKSKAPPPPMLRPASEPDATTPRTRRNNSCVPSSEPSPGHRRVASTLAPAKINVNTPSPSHRRAMSTPHSPVSEVVDLPTPTTRVRSGRPLHSPAVPTQRWVAAQEPVSFGVNAGAAPLSGLSPHSRARERWSIAAKNVTNSNQPKTFADIVLESRRVRAPPRAMEGGFRELVVLLAAMRRSKGVSEEQQYKLKSMMLSRDIDEVKRAKEFLEELDQYTEQNETISAGDNSVHTLFPYMSELDDVSKIIHTPKGYEYFFSFLESEYSQENLLFWRSVKNFERDFASDKTTAEIKEHAMRLWDLYIGPQAENMINLSSITVKGFKDQLFSKSRLSADLLFQACEAAKADIENLLARDSFQRFKKSALYSKLVEDAQVYHTPQKREKRRGGSDLIREFFGKHDSA